MRMRRALALTLLCMVAFVHSVCAETIPPRGSIDPRVRTVAYDADDVVKLHGYVGYQIHIEWAPGEEFVSSYLTVVEFESVTHRALKGRLLRPALYRRILGRFTDDARDWLALHEVTHLPPRVSHGLVPIAVTCLKRGTSRRLEGDHRTQNTRGDRCRHLPGCGGKCAHAESHKHNQDADQRRHAQHEGARGAIPERRRTLFKGETKRKRLAIPMFLGKVE